MYHLNVLMMNVLHSSLLITVLLFVTGTSAGEIKLHVLEDPMQGITPLTIEQENQIISGLTAGISATVGNVRDAHPKAHGCVYAQLSLDNDLASENRVGVFAFPNKNEGVTYDAIARFSHGSSDVNADDRAPGVHGMAVKIFLPEDLQKQVEIIPEEQQFPTTSTGLFSPGYSNPYQTFDIITINGVEEFLANDLSSYPAFIKASKMAGEASKTAAKAGKTPAEIGGIAGKIFFDEYVSTIPKSLQPVVGALVGRLGAVQVKNILLETYNSWVPYAFDEKRAVKYSFRPCQNPPIYAPVASTPNFLGEQLVSDLTQNRGCFELVAQFHEDGMPSVENAALPWGKCEDRKYVRLATLMLTSTMADPKYCEALSFNPGHALPNQRGIGAMQRARRMIYAAIETHRNKNRMGK